MRSFVRDSAGGLVPMMDAGAADVPARIGIARKSTAQRVNGIVVNSEQSILIKERLPVGIGSLEAAASESKTRSLQRVVQPFGWRWDSE